MDSAAPPSAPAVLSVDLEDWYSSSLVLFGLDESAEAHTPPVTVCDNTRFLLDLLDRYASRATFFVLWSIAEHFPDLIRELVQRGHEVAAHGTSHRLVYRQTAEEFRDDVQRCLDVLAPLTGRPVLGYRAPYFSITRASLWALDVLVELGLRYDSSIFPIARRLYGIPDYSLSPVVVETAGGPLLEVPLSAWPVLGLRVPIAGGGYWRLLPSMVVQRALAAIHRGGRPLVLYCHPYELNPDDLGAGPQRTDWRSRLTVWSQRLGRRRYAARTEAVLAAFPTIPLCDAFGDVLAKLDRAGVDAEHRSPRPHDGLPGRADPS